MLTYIHLEAVKKFVKRNGLESPRPSINLLEKLGESFGKMPYENMTKMIRAHSISDAKARIRLPELLYEEFLRYGTGGTCFSMTYFMQTILCSLGFETYPVMADRPLAPDTHCASVIVLGDKKYLMDPGFMIDCPLPLTEIPERHRLRHNEIIIGAKGTIPISANQLKHFRGLREKLDGKISLPYELNSCHSSPLCHSEGVKRPKNPPLTAFQRKILRRAQNDNERRIQNDKYDHTSIFTIATAAKDKITIRYFMKDKDVSNDNFLAFWLDSFNWPSLRNISITKTSNDGYIYARNNFLRTTTSEGRKQLRIKDRLDLELGKAFNIDPVIINNALDLVGLQSRPTRSD